jgi:copper homeostasis protein
MEVCVEGVESALAAEAGGAHRVELCAALLEGGVTPSKGTIEMCRRQLGIKLHVIIRPRGGDFLYSEVEHETMLHDVDTAKRLGVDGVVVGELNAEGRIERRRTAALIERARPMSVTYHRAFDVTRDPHEALEDLIDLGVDRVLTSGQETSALAGLDLLCDLVKEAGDRIIIIPCGDINERNIRKIAARTGARELHVTGTKTVQSRMTHRNDRVFMGGALRPPEYSRAVTDEMRVSELVRRAKKSDSA